MVSSKKLKRLWPIAGILSVVIISIQFIQVPVQNGKTTHPINAPEEVTKIFRKACYDCHSNETKLSWYDKVAPVSWLVNHDVEEGRSRFNFSTFDTLSATDQQVRLWEMVNMALAGKMPLNSYTTLHLAAKLTQHDVEVLKNYVVSISPTKYHDSTQLKSAEEEQKVVGDGSTTSKNIPVAPNGVRFIPDYKNWEVISTTSRFDNHTMRVIYGNKVTVNAIRNGRIKPFPDGAAIVKVVYNIIEEKNGEVHPGAFNNIQIMIKDEKRFPESKGWGFGKFNGTGLKPYGETAAFNTTCYNCHKIADETGYVFSIPLENKDLK
ncbi:heme-binding domain-containing protein [Mucilaginibacter sp. UR6-1]|uniref:heme-binding domain-containing protein n=1 Tax=Mucilaginibacter sp. UR6-1 TaxID=1435643 RepID=UPI001E35F6B5|nr:heme-binding domain-containing protein [Mucilaginibacter sp. UR6-1]MCC8408598.1 heme-binding domain-containing protein [Mucilaginibacter sp. UR6-1]